jgi:hypothetical protein
LKKLASALWNRRLTDFIVIDREEFSMPPGGPKDVKVV